MEECLFITLREPFQKVLRTFSVIWETTLRQINQLNNKFKKHGYILFAFRPDEIVLTLCFDASPGWIALAANLR